MKDKEIPAKFEQTVVKHPEVDVLAQLVDMWSHSEARLKSWWSTFSMAKRCQT